jgi:hypothetical protein
MKGIPSMAIFTDKNQIHHIGVLFFEQESKYTGNFVLIEKKTLLYLLKLNSILNWVLFMLLLFCFVFSVVSSSFFRPEESNYVFACFGALPLLVLVFYAIGALALSSRKVKCENKAMKCQTQESRGIYLVYLQSITLLAFSVVSMPAITFVEIWPKTLFLLGPVFAGSLYAVIRYSRNDS